MNDFWNTRYTEPTFAYGIRPNVFFQEQLDKLPPGTLLLPAEGEGRNAVYAAQKGWAVTAFDFSEQARVKTLQLAKQHDVTLHYVVQDVQDFEAGDVVYDAVGLFYSHFPANLRVDFHRKITHLVKKSGYVILEGFHKNQLQYTSGGPKDERMLFSVEELRQEFSGLTIRMFDDLVVDLNEGIYHQGKAHVVRMIATND